MLVNAAIACAKSSTACAGLSVQHGIQLEVVKLPYAERGFVPAASAMGGSTLLCLDDQNPSAGARWRLPATLAGTWSYLLACCFSNGEPFPVLDLMRRANPHRLEFHPVSLVQDVERIEGHPFIERTSFLLAP
jgi:hypothetical protein